MKRPEGFDEGDARRDAPAEAAEAPRQRRGPSKPRLPFRGRVADDREARPASAESAAAVETPAPTTPGSTPAPGSSGTRPLAVGAPPSVGARRPSAGADPTTDAADSTRDRVGAFAGAAGRRFGAGLSTVADRLREYTPNEDHRDPEADRRDAERRAATSGGADHDATVTDVLDATVASRTDQHTEAPIGARVRAAETAREARIAKRRRRLLERAEVRRFTRRSRHRRAAWITAASVVLVLGVSILVAVFSPLMALRTIEVKGTNRVDESALRQALSDQIGTPLARLDFDAIKRDVAGFPLIESYVTEEAPPHTLVVTVTERTPVVAVRSGSTFDLVDPAGIVVQSSPKRPATMPLADIARARLGSSSFRTMTEVVLALPSTVRSQVTRVAGSTADDVTLTLKDGSTVVWGSPDDSDAKAELLAALVKDHAARNPGVVVEYDVSAPDNGVIRAKD
ncbi:FtsQ-type POTRA domain-containing protein [Curtobacterium flaccumfaciens pv. flaccumfaciens]|uniref:FtsQ-type POTRA domain-containing protein n=1 Tax=Curtobacterium flaccumfaciens TaxID=2035 RepID=UPI00217D4347|nr:FtsQ-type POTRA domain-containing protein [Curtobacterium flaccumfaciens]MCS6554104.1 FtsQ-type POTRA domain-containing protein [Curtobacterium flaccumfaciens]QYI98083.1 FtsQ-type POTRA domain-containing protein [Curtobacterium flaccumfaciens pv. flaccumfaciens]